MHQSVENNSFSMLLTLMLINHQLHWLRSLNERRSWWIVLRFRKKTLKWNLWSLMWFGHEDDKVLKVLQSMRLRKRRKIRMERLKEASYSRLSKVIKLQSYSSKLKSEFSNSENHWFRPIWLLRIRKFWSKLMKKSWRFLKFWCSHLKKEMRFRFKFVVWCYWSTSYNWRSNHIKNRKKWKKWSMTIWRKKRAKSLRLKHLNRRLNKWTSNWISQFHHRSSLRQTHFVLRRKISLRIFS